MPAVRLCSVAEALERLAACGILVYPTETYYGLGSALETAAVDRILKLKGRQPDKPLPILVGTRKMVDMLRATLPLPARLLAERFWPGPLTLVLRAAENLPAGVVGSGLVGVRVSSHPVAAQLSRALGGPIVATSANPAGMPAPIHVGTAITYFRDQVDGYLDGGVLPGRGSTVVKIDEGRARLLRPGAVSLGALRQALPELEA